MSKRKYNVQLIPSDLAKIVKGKKIMLRWVDFNVQVERDDVHRISVITESIKRKE